MVEIGDVLNNRYVVASVLGSGALGTVFSCRDLHKGNLVAVKTSEFAGVWQEAQIMLAHPSIPQVIDLFRVGDQEYYVMEQVKGVHLQQYVKAHPGLTHHDVRELLIKATEVIIFLHNRGIRHNDVTDNFLVDAEKNVYLIDFGMAMQSEDGSFDLRGLIKLCLGIAKYTRDDALVASLTSSAPQSIYALMELLRYSP